MISKLVLGAILVGVFSRHSSAQDSDFRTTEQTLAAVLRWEVLWNDSPVGFRLPNNGRVALAIYATFDSVSYCSHQAGVCVMYKTSGYQNWEAARSAKCEDDSTDQASLLAFVGQQSVRRTGKQEAPFVVGKGGFIGAPTQGSGVLWSLNVYLGTRAEIIRQYKQIHAEDIRGLERWIRAGTTGDAGVKSIRIACFAATDPMVYYYVDRPAKGPVVMAVFWDRERRTWGVASSLERSQGGERFEDMKRTIESITCSTIKFD